MNSTNFVGRLTKDPELKYTPAGKAVATFTLAVNRSFKSEGQPTADFIRVKVWNKPAENAQKYLKRGSLISIQARVETGSYDGSDGKKVYTTEFVANEITYLEKASGNTSTENQSSNNQQSNQQNQNQNNQSSNQDPFSSGSGPIEVSDDDLPF